MPVTSPASRSGSRHDEGESLSPISLGLPNNGAAWAPIARVPRFLAPASTVTRAQAGHGWTGSGGFVANDTTDFVMGSQAMSIPAPAVAT